MPSRDDLKYTDRTKAAIRSALKTMVDDLQVVVSKMLDSAATEWQALEQFQRIDTVRGIRDVVTTINWRGKTIDTQKGIVRTIADIQKLDKSADITAYGITSTNRATPEIVSSPCLMPGQRHYLMIDDMTKGGVNVAKGYCFTHLVNRSTSTGRALRYGHTVGHVVLVKTKLTKQQLSDFFGGFPEDQILTASSVSGKIKMPAGMKGNDALYRFDGGKTWGARVNVPTGGPFFYLELAQNQHSKRWVPENFDADDVRNLLQMAREFKIDVPVLYGIKKDEVSQFDSTTWKPLLPALKAAAQKIIDRDKIKAVRFQRNVDRDADTVAKLIKAVGAVDDTMKRFLDEYNLTYEAKNDAELMYCAKGRSHRLDLKLEWPTATNNAVPSIAALYEAVFQKFPMLKACVGLAATTGYYGYRGQDNPFTSHKNIIADYIGNRR